MASRNCKLMLLREEQVTAEWSHKFDRKTYEELDLHIPYLWKQETKSNTRLYNATKFRLHTWCYNADGSLHLYLGLTSYRDYVCTNQASHSKKYQEWGLNCLGNPQEYMADPLAVGAYLETTDRFLVFIKRNSWCGESPNLIDRPGGHPEPQDLVSNPESSDLESFVSESLVAEIFSSIKREIRDELNVGLEFMEETLLLGIFRNEETGGRPIMDFYIRCSLSKADVERLYKLGTQSEADESTAVVFLDRDSLLQGEKMPLYDQMTPSLKTSLPLLQAFITKQTS